MKRKLGLVFMMGLMALNSSVSQAGAPAKEEAPGDIGYVIGDTLGAIGSSAVGVFGLGLAMAQKQSTDTLKSAYHREEIEYGRRSLAGFVPGGNDGVSFEKAFIDHDKQLNQWDRESFILTEKYKLRIADLESRHVPKTFPAYAEAKELIDKAIKLDNASRSRKAELLDYYRYGAKGLYKGKNLSLNEVNAILVFRENEREAWRKGMRQEIRKGEKGLIGPSLTAAVGSAGAAYFIYKGVQVSKNLKKAEAESQGGPDRVPASQGTVNAAAQ